MPVDFIPNIFFSPNTFQKRNIAAQPVFRQQDKDTFVKTINVQNDNKSDIQGLTVTKSDFGTLSKSGKKAYLYTITNKNGASVQLSDFGATIVSIKVPDKNGKLTDVTQGYKDVQPYENCPVGHAGGTIGPCANKIDNGQFEINGRVYDLEKNKDNGKTHCHGGSDGLDVKLWKTKVLSNGIQFSYRKKDMENGYPANVDIKVTYIFDNDNNLRIKYSAKADNDTLLNMTNHTYFNLDGEENAYENSVLNHIVKLPNSSQITENNKIAIPTGKFIPVENTPFDFRKAHKISDLIDEKSEQMEIAKGYDQNYCIDNYDGKTMIEIAEVESEKTGIKLKVSTDLPGFQFYTANHLGKKTQPDGKSGSRYEKRSGVCIEPQFYPNAINTPEFAEKGVLRKGDNYDREIVYSFSS